MGCTLRVHTEDWMTKLGIRTLRSEKAMEKIDILEDGIDVVLSSHMLEHTEYAFLLFDNITHLCLGRFCENIEKLHLLNQYGFIKGADSDPLDKIRYRGVVSGFMPEVFNHILYFMERTLEYFDDMFELLKKKSGEILFFRRIPWELMLASPSYKPVFGGVYGRFSFTTCPPETIIRVKVDDPNSSKLTMRPVILGRNEQ